MKQPDLKQRLYIIVLKVIAALCIFSLIGNSIWDFPLKTNIKWVFLLGLVVFMYSYECNRGSSNFVKFIFFMFLNGVFMPLSYIDAGGFGSNTIAYVFLSLIVVTFLFENYLQYVLICTTILAFMGVHTYGYLNPAIIPVYNENSRYFDVMTQIPIILVITFLIVRCFADAYNQTNKKLLQYAHYDELTGLINRRNFNDILQNQLDSDERKGYLIMIDVDNFKFINDKKGHLAGDDSLKQLSGILRKHFDDGRNMISRWGGDEFIIIYFGDTLQLDAIFEKVKREFKEYINLIEPVIDISFGVAPLQGCQTPDAVFDRADQIMYEKKRNKRSCEN